MFVIVTINVLCMIYIENEKQQLFAKFKKKYFSWFSAEKIFVSSHMMKYLNSLPY